MNSKVIMALTRFNIARWFINSSLCHVMWKQRPV